MVFPSGFTPVPDVVAAIAAGRPVEAVWLNELGGITWRIDGGTSPVNEAGEGRARRGRAGLETEYVKAGAGEFVAEAQRLEWAGRYAVVPKVLGVGTDWLHTAGLAGVSAVDPHWVAQPRQAARAIGAGLRALHDRLPVESCPWVRADFDDAPPAERLVVCHGDACAPNTLIGADGWCSGHVDLGSLGVADRWADLAIATLSLSWNYAVSYEDELLGAYGVEPDADRIDYYRRRWQDPAPDDGYPR